MSDVLIVILAIAVFVVAVPLMGAVMAKLMDLFAKWLKL